MAIASAGLFAELDRTVRASPARSGQMLSRVAALLSVTDEPIAEAG